MKVTKRLILIIMVSVFTFWQCDKEPEEPDCAVECDIGTEEYSIVITCESGSTTTTYNNESTEYEYDDSGLSGLKLNLNQTRTYENTNNTYQIVGVINVNLRQNTVTHNITVSGGVFNDPQTCN
jgi:hypothetical protein